MIINTEYSVSQKTIVFLGKNVEIQNKSKKNKNKNNN